MIPGSASAVVVGATDVGRTAEFLGTFGFAPDEGGSEDSCTLRAARSPVAVEVARAERTAGPPRDFDTGPRALDIYTGDMVAALAAVRAAGWQHGPVGTLAIGPLVMGQVLVEGPDGLPVVLVEANRRRSSLLDTDDSLLFGGPHSVVWCVADLDAESARWAAAGLTKGPALAFEEPAVSEYLGLPRPSVPIRMTMLSGPEVEPIRLELLEFPDDRPAEVPHGGAGTPDAGIRALRFAVADPAGASAALGIGPAGGVTPGGIVVELETAAS